MRAGGRAPWVIAMRWRAQLSWRLPPRSRRWRWCLPELAWSGATPPWRASCASVRKRSIGPISESSFAAVEGAAAGELEQRRRESLRQRLQFAVELDDRAGQRAAAAERGRGRCAPASTVRGGRAGARRGRARPHGRAHRAAREVSGRAGAGASAAVAGSGAARATRSSRWSTSSFSSRSVSSPGRGPSRCGSRSAARATASASIGSDLPRVRPRAPLRRGQLRRHPHQLFAGSEQRPLECARHAAGNPRPPTAAPRQASAPTRRHCVVDRTDVLIERRAQLRRRRPRSASACVRPPRPRSLTSPPTDDGGDRRADRPHSRQLPSSYQVTLDGLGKAAATQRWQVSTRATFGNGVSRRRPESLLSTADATIRQE